MRSLQGKYTWCVLLEKTGRVLMSEDEFEKHLEQMNKYEAVFWSKSDGKDEMVLRG